METDGMCGKGECHSGGHGWLYGFVRSDVVVLHQSVVFVRVSRERSADWFDGRPRHD